MVDQWGFQPQFQRSERCVLCDWTTGRKVWYGYEESNLNLNVRSVPSFPLNDTRKKSGWPPRPRTWNLRVQSAARCQIAPAASGMPGRIDARIERAAQLLRLLG